MGCSVSATVNRYRVGGVGGGGGTGGPFGGITTGTSNLGGLMMGALATPRGMSGLARAPEIGDVVSFCAAVFAAAGVAGCEFAVEAANERVAATISGVKR
jgi:hypothetical protein